jgi:tetratricopeptide (TPR) repeat protein
MALERLAACEDPKARQGAKERLGEIFEQAGNRSAAVESWRSAAQLCETSQGEQERVRSLYERVLEAAPDDGEAARRLVILYADREEWNKVPELMGVVLRTDCERGSELLLRLAPRALDGWLRDGLVAMIDEAIAWLRPSSAWVRELQHAKARALAAPPTRYAEACDAFRALVDTFGSADDAREYEAFIASIPDADERHGQRRFLYQWRAARDAQPGAVLFAWAQEEEAHGAPEAAIAIYERFVQIAQDRDRAPAALRIARMLVDLGRPVEARGWLRRATEFPVRVRLIELYRCDTAWEPLASILSDASTRSEDPRQRVAYLREAAAVLQDKLGQPGAAAAALELALPAAPRDTGLHVELAGLLESLGEWPRAANVLRQCIAACCEPSPKERAILYQRLARALRSASDLEGALAQLRAAARLQPRIRRSSWTSGKSRSMRVVSTSLRARIERCSWYSAIPSRRVRQSHAPRSSSA